MNSTADSLESMTIAQRRELHSLCWAFEEALESGQPRIEDWLDRSIEVDPELLLHELLVIEMERRSCPTDDSSVRLYLDRFPAHRSCVLEAFSVAEKSNVRRDASPCADDRRYEFIHEIARGGAGSVWRVYDRHMKRESAVKVLLDSNDNLEMRRRLENEARLAGRLQHPGIVPVHELDRLDNGRPFINMKLIEGSTFETLIANGTADRDELLQIFRSICEAVAYAHQNEIVHRDIKPSNVMVGAFNEVQVMDWGLAKDLSESMTDTLSDTESTTVAAESHQTISGSIFGTPAYMSPEQARGETRRIGKPTDVFSLGAILCKIVIGRSPYQLSQSGALLAATNADLTPVLERLSRCKKSDRGLAQLTIDCLNVDPSVRPADASVLLSRLDSIRLNRRSRPMVRRLAFLVLAAAAMLIAIGIGSRRIVTNQVAAESVQPTESPEAAGIEEQLVRVRQMMEQGEYAESNQVCRQIIQEDPSCGEAFYYQSHSFYELGRFVDAEASLRRAEELAPGMVEVNMVRRYKDLYRRLANIERTLPESARPNDGRSPRDCLDLADFFGHRGEWQLAMTHYRQAFAEPSEMSTELQLSERYQSVARFACVQLKRPDLVEDDRNKLVAFSAEMLQANLDLANRSDPDTQGELHGRSDSQARLILNASELQPIRDAANDPSVDETLRVRLKTLLATAQSFVQKSN